MVRSRPLWNTDMRKLSEMSSRCCPNASTLYPCRRAAAYSRPRFIREQKLQMLLQSTASACCRMPEHRDRPAERHHSRIAHGQRCSRQSQQEYGRANETRRTLLDNNGQGLIFEGCFNSLQQAAITRAIFQIYFKVNEEGVHSFAPSSTNILFTLLRDFVSDR